MTLQLHCRTDSMEGKNNPQEECWVCGRKLPGSRWVKGTNQLKHSGRTVAEGLGNLLACESQVMWVCFRCYRLVLALDYHTYQMEKQRLALIRLYDTRDQTKQQSGHTLPEKNLYNDKEARFGNKPSVSRQTDNICMREQRSRGSEHVGVGKKSHHVSSSLAYTMGKEMLAYTLQSVYDHEHNRNNDQNNSCKQATVRPGKILPNTRFLFHKDCINDSISDSYIPIENEKARHNSNDGNVFKNQDQENQDRKQDEIIMGESISERRGLRRKKVVKKWDDFEYYEDESKNLETESDLLDPLPPPQQQYQVPTRIGRKKCQECKEDFATRKAILNHKCFQIKGTEREQAHYKCKGCLHVFLLRREYIKHVSTCYKNTPVTCNLCLVKLPSAAFLPRHFASLHQVKSSLSKSDILCELCGRGFSRKEALERHEARIHGKSHGCHQCPLCGHTFPHTSLLAEHLRAHQGYTCPDCSKVFSCKSNLNLHRRAHHMRKAAYHCTDCNRHWKFHASYVYHMKKFHRSSAYMCSSCNVLYSEEALNQHSLTCGSQNTNCSTRHEVQRERKLNNDESINQTSNDTDSLYPNGRLTHLNKETDRLLMVPEVREMQVSDLLNTFPVNTPKCEIVVEVLEENDADCQCIILVEDIDDNPSLPFN